jgi:hypothetical protein
LFHFGKFFPKVPPVGGLGICVVESGLAAHDSVMPNLYEGVRGNPGYNKLGIGEWERVGLENLDVAVCWPSLTFWLKTDSRNRE